MIQRNYLQIRQEVEDLVAAEMERILSDPGMVGTMLKKPERKVLVLAKSFFDKIWLALILLSAAKSFYLYLLLAGINLFICSQINKN